MYMFIQQVRDKCHFGNIVTLFENNLSNEEYFLSVEIKNFRFKTSNLKMAQIYYKCNTGILIPHAHVCTCKSLWAKKITKIQIFLRLVILTLLEIDISFFGKSSRI